MRYNLEKISRSFFPWFWHIDENLRFVDLVVGGLNQVNTNQFNAELDYNQRVGYSIQRLSLEISLNDRFDSDQRRIIVANGSIGGNEFIFNEVETPSLPLTIFIWNESETPPVGQSDPFFFNEQETSQAAVTGFTVFVPSELMSSENFIRAWIDNPLITSTEYNIEYI